MIGNDIIDRQLAGMQSNWKRKGFCEKVFTTSEQEFLFSGDENDLRVWLLWSMKEAAYKAHQRKFLLPRRLNWTMLECYPIQISGGGAQGLVSIEGNKYLTFSEIDSEVIHTTASASFTSAMNKRLLTASGAEMKELFLREVSPVLNLSSREMSIKKDSFGIPFLAHEKIALNMPFSFSDHGRFAGFCFPLTNS